MVKPSLIPLGNKILVKPLKAQEKTQAGIIIPVVVNKELEEGIVISFSPNVLHVNPGDKILYPSRAGIEMIIDDENYKFINGPIINEPGDIIAILEQVQ